LIQRPLSNLLIKELVAEMDVEEREDADLGSRSGKEEEEEEYHEQL
jgi:hypothetical protein